MATYTDNTNRFTGRAQSYAKYRPGYPKESIDFIASNLPIKRGDKILDMGSGTGILSAILFNDLDKDLDISVVGLEPNADMRAEQEITMKPFMDKGLFRSLTGTAEATTLPDQSIDVAVAAAAFHWFDGPSTRAEVRRVVKSRDGKGAPMAIFTAADDDQPPPGFEREKAVMDEFREIRRSEGMTSTAEANKQKGSDEALDAFFGGREQWSKTNFPHIRRMTWDNLRGIMQSFSVCPMEGTPEHDALIEKLRVLFDKHQIDGEIRALRLGRLVYGYVK